MACTCENRKARCNLIINLLVVNVFLLYIVFIYCTDDKHDIVIFIKNLKVIIVKYVNFIVFNNINIFININIIDIQKK